MSQFAFLKAEFPDVHALAAQAEGSAHADPRAACVHARLALETVVNWLYRYDGSLKPPYDRTLSARIHEPTFRALVGERGAMDPRLLYESPFTDIDPMGIGGLFSKRDVEEVVSILDTVRKRAAA
jgi:type I restriction enzyme R subunit